MSKIINSNEFDVNDFEVSLYVKDLNVKIDMYRGSFRITDLTNALKGGKTCRKWNVYCNQYYNDGVDSGRYILSETMRLNNTDLTGLVEMLKNGEEIELESVAKYLNIGELSLEATDVKACRVYSPFAKVPKQDFEKITPAKLPKAIANGQVESIITESYYSDDYAYDYATNYHEGVVKNIHDMAKDLAEGADGWWMKKISDKEYSLNCYSFASYVVKVA